MKKAGRDRHVAAKLLRKPDGPSVHEENGRRKTITTDGADRADAIASIRVIRDIRCGSSPVARCES